MSWQKAIILNPNEQVLHSWDGDCERHHKTVVPEKGLIRTKYVTKEAKERTSGTLVLTNQRLLWFERRGMFSKTLRASFEIDLKELQGITGGGTINKWVSITDKDGENVFHLRNVGKNEIESFKDMIIRQVEGLRETVAQREVTIRETREAPIVQKEVVVKEIVKVPCEYCNALMEQTSSKCPECGAPQRKRS